jgi:hypothetical protein
MTDEFLKDVERKLLWLSQGTNLSFAWRDSRKTTHKLGQDSQCSGRTLCDTINSYDTE